MYQPQSQSITSNEFRAGIAVELTGATEKKAGPPERSQGEARVFATIHKLEYYLHAIPSEADTAEFAAQSASKHDAIVKTATELQDQVNELGTNVSEVAKEVDALETTEFQLPSGTGTGSQMVEGSFRSPEIVKEELVRDRTTRARH